MYNVLLIVKDISQSKLSALGHPPPSLHNIWILTIYSAYFIYNHSLSNWPCSPYDIFAFEAQRPNNETISLFHVHFSINLSRTDKCCCIC